MWVYCLCGPVPSGPLLYTTTSTTLCIALGELWLGCCSSISWSSFTVLELIWEPREGWTFVCCIYSAEGWRPDHTVPQHPLTCSVSLPVCQPSTIFPTFKSEQRWTGSSGEVREHLPERFSCGVSSCCSPEDLFVGRTSQNDTETLHYLKYKYTLFISLFHSS